MNAELREVDFREPQFADRIGCSLGNIEISLLNTHEDRPGSIKVDLRSRQTELHEFAERGSRTIHGAFPAIIFVLLFDLTVLLMGLFSIYSIDRNGKLDKLLDLFRNPLDDAGFFQTPALLLAGEWVLLKYEAGIVCFDLQGKLNWHKKLHYDDILERFDDTNIWFSNEHIDNERPWSICLSNGKVD